MSELIGDIYCDLETWHHAIIEYKAAVSDDPQNALVHLKLGRCYINVDKPAKAKREYFRASNLDRNIWDLLSVEYYFLGSYYEEKSDLDRAMEEYYEAIRLNPQNVDPLLSLSEIYSAYGQVDDEIFELKEILLIDPDKAISEFRPAYEAIAHGKLGLAYFNQNNLSIAMKELEEAIRLGSRDPKVNITLGCVHAIQGEFEKAVGQYLRTLNLDPRYTDAHMYLGHVYEVQGKHDAAFKEFQEVLRQDPNNMDAVLDLRRVSLLSTKTKKTKIIRAGFECHSSLMAGRPCSHG